MYGLSLTENHHLVLADLEKKTFFVNSDILGIKFGGKKGLNKDIFEIATKLRRSNI